MNQHISFKNLSAWNKSMELCKFVYLLSESLLTNEVFGISSQMKRAAVSIPSNIAEGYKRKNRKEYVNFLSIASGSAGELETQLIICTEVLGIDTVTHQNLVTEVQKLLFVMINSLSKQ